MSEHQSTRKRAPIRTLPSVAYLRECLVYYPESGELRWRERPREHFTSSRYWHRWNANQAWTIAGTNGPGGYRQIKLDRHPYRAHRILWKIFTGEEPPAIIDHIDGDRDNNTWDNLRPATAEEQQHNRGLSKNNTTGLRGIYPTGNKWRARISANLIRYNLGTFDTPEGASIAYEIAARELHGEFYRNPNDQITAPPLKLARTRSR
jgi:hypothetical protein